MTNQQQQPHVPANRDIRHLQLQLQQIMQAINQLAVEVRAINQLAVEIRDRQLAFEANANQHPSLQHQVPNQSIDAPIPGLSANIVDHTNPQPVVSDIGPISHGPFNATSSEPDGVSPPAADASALKPSPEIESRGTASEAAWWKPHMMGNVERHSPPPSYPGVDINVATSPVSGIIGPESAPNGEGCTHPTIVQSNTTPTFSAPPIVTSSNGETFITTTYSAPTRVQSNTHCTSSAPPIVAFSAPPIVASTYTLPPQTDHPDEPLSMFSNIRGKSPMKRIQEAQHAHDGHDIDLGYHVEDRTQVGMTGGVPGQGLVSFKPFRPKPDISAFPDLTTNKMFDKWYYSFIGTARAMDCYDLFDSSYTPRTQRERERFHQKSRWFYAVFQKVVQTTTGKVIVEQHFHDMDCFAILQKLVDDAHTSVAGTLESVKTLSWLTSIRYIPLKHGSASGFIIKFDRALTEYNDCQKNHGDKISNGMKKTFLQQAVRDVKSFNDIRVREHESMSRNGSSASFTYKQYLETLKGAAVLYDVKGVETSHIKVPGLWQDDDIPDYIYGEQRAGDASYEVPHTPRQPEPDGQEGQDFPRGG